jgi:hypothetical protein
MSSKDRERTAPQQTQMFKTPEMVQFGTRKYGAEATEWLRNTKAPPLILAAQDVRTPEEIERDLHRAAEKLTISLFDESLSEAKVEPSTPPKITIPVIVFDSESQRKVVGLRARLRAESLANGRKQHAS